MEQNTAWEHKAESGRVKQAKTSARKANTTQRLAAVNILSEVNLEQLLSLKLVDLDAQIDKLREAGDREIPPKSRIGKKQAKAEEILKALSRRQVQMLGKDVDNRNKEMSYDDAEMSDARSEESQDGDIGMDIDPEWEY
ncbi:hypothetical protein RSOLAG1IB_10961 [Rhizoctonia solani AG-1 IB]|uniref:Uncharacterized protein n=1 Tax=Thanatephorus cucumeris (strain AG1-IB / isolate 7/3/14) TaxID=1108050 RepID=M5BWN6_THACB|nr:hypothetical protein BN14_05617 [Rhizoctonia solani AG-1 IB]CEL63978.1 hypothetical protein RSOLAG1IB_10961 [Rhizoctonia solani AG-1 IB]